VQCVRKGAEIQKGDSGYNAWGRDRIDRWLEAIFETTKSLLAASARSHDFTDISGRLAILIPSACGEDSYSAINTPQHPQQNTVRINQRSSSLSSSRGVK
jgi:hypothetical protein